MSILKRLRGDRRGVAMLEFALLLPLIVMLMTGGIELGNLVLTKIRTERLARSIADMIARQSGSPEGLSERQFNDIMFAAMRQNAGMSMTEKGRIIVTAAVGIDADFNNIPERNAIQWQRFTGKYIKGPIVMGCWSKNDTAVLPRNRQLVANEPIYHVQVTHKYEPIMGVLFDAMDVPTEINDVAMFRGRGAQFRPMLTSMNEPVHDKCDTPDGL